MRKLGTGGILLLLAMVSIALGDRPFIEHLLFGLISWLASLPAIGYLLRLMEGGVDDELPEWGGWADLFLSGFEGFVIVFSYFVIPLLLLSGGAGIFFGDKFLVPLSVILLGAGSLLFILAVFFCGASLVAFIREGRLAAAYTLSGIIGDVGDRPGAYAAASAAAFGILITGGIIAAFLFGAGPWFGAVLVPFLAFYLGIVAALFYRDLAG